MIEPIVDADLSITSDILKDTSIASISHERDVLYTKFKAKIAVHPALDRMLVSYQASKDVAFSRWFKYKEGFSEALVSYLLQGLTPGTLLDPFSGAGSALFAASTLGWQTQGIEVLPVGVHATHSRQLASKVDVQQFRTIVQEMRKLDFAQFYDQTYQLRHIPITRGAFPEPEEMQLVGYITYCHRHIADESLQSILLFAVFCILEEISYTRKDGQYLRWDARSGRSLGENTFHKGYIAGFREALHEKLHQMLSDLEGCVVQPSLFSEEHPLTDSSSPPLVHEGSCLEILPTLAENTFDAILTSPPYANRYDYTRTYALELIYLGCSEERVKQLRQTMLSCTVENKKKDEQLHTYYASLEREEDFRTITSVFHEQKALQEVLSLLNRYHEQGKLNNTGIARMIHNYFYEMCFTIYELARTLKQGGTIMMVNDNVRYAGEEIPVDLILSDIAASFGLTIKHIWTLGRGKGNSSQQMGNHGRSELRKCVYVWEKEYYLSPMICNTIRYEKFHCFPNTD